MNKKSELDCFLYFMWNRWDKDECLALFGENLGQHVWEKWLRDRREYGAVGAPAALYSVLDSDKRRQIVERAINHYNG